MYKKGSFLEPNKELKFGGIKKKGKYQSGGLSNKEEEARAGTPRAEAAAKAKAAAAAKERNIDKIKASAPSGSTAMSVLNQNEFISGNRAANSSNKASTVAKFYDAKPATKIATDAAKKPAAASSTSTSTSTSTSDSEPKPGTYAYAKKQNPNLDKLIAERKKYAKGSDDYNRVQNQINKAYDAGPVRKEATQVARPAPAVNKISTSTPKPELAVKKPASPAATPAAKAPAAKTTPTASKTKTSAQASTTASKPKTSTLADRRTPSAQKIASKNARKNKRLGKMEERMAKIKGKMQAGGFKPVPSGSKGAGLSKLPKPVRNKMGYLKLGGYKK